MSAELDALEGEWARVVERKDFDGARRLLADDFLLSSTGGVGDRVTRDAWFENLAAMDTTALAAEVLDTRVFGDIGVVRARLRWEATLRDRDLTGDYLVTDVFRREDARWRAVWRISTRLTDA